MTKQIKWHTTNAYFKKNGLANCKISEMILIAAADKTSYLNIRNSRQTTEGATGLLHLELETSAVFSTAYEFKRAKTVSIWHLSSQNNFLHHQSTLKSILRDASSSL